MHALVGIREQNAFHIGNHVQLSADTDLKLFYLKMPGRATHDFDANM